MAVSPVRYRVADALSFFFQAEEGIRDTSVTGVQTCALPICWRAGTAFCREFLVPPGVKLASGTMVRLVCGSRSEERRVGKECRWRWSPKSYKKKDRRMYMVEESSVGRITRRCADGRAGQ